MSRTYTTLSREAINYLCSVINQVVSLPTDVIDNLNLATNTTYSSIKIKTIVDKTLEDAKEYANEVCAALVKLECRKTTTQPTLENSDINVIYLYSADGNAPFQQYLKISETELVDMGSTNINLDGYLTATEITRDYVTKLDFNTLKTEVDKKLNKTDVDNITIINADGVNIKDFILENCTDMSKVYHITTRSNCTDTPKEGIYYYMTVQKIGTSTIKVTAKGGGISNNEYVCTYRSDSAKWSDWEKVLLSSDISTTIDSTSTDDTVPTNKTIYDNLIKNNIKTYYLLSQLGITSSCTIKDIWDKMPLNSIAIIDTNSSIVTDLDVFKVALGVFGDNQFVYGFLTVGKFTERTILEFRRSHTLTPIIPETFIGYCIGNNCTTIQWKQMVIANIDVPPTKITFSDTTNYSIVSDTCEYYVKNGICTILLYVKCETPSTNWITVANVPKAKTMNQYKMLVNPDGDKILKCVFKPDGSLQFSKGVAGTSYIGTVSYPVAYD